MSALTATDLRVALPTGTFAVDGVSLHVPAGGWLAVLGPNGAGKSTLLRALAGLIPYQGTVSFDPGPARRGRRELARVLAYLPQRPVLPPDLTVRDYVLLGRTPYLGYLGVPGAQDRVLADGVLTRLELQDLAARRLGTLSGGERQRAAMARALAQSPRVLLLDEPTTALDLGHQQQVLELVDTLRKEDGLTVVSTLHDLTAAAQYAEQLLLLDRGRTAAFGTPAEVLTADRIKAVYRALVSVSTDTSGIPSVSPIRADRPEVHADAMSTLRDHGPPSNP